MGTEPRILVLLHGYEDDPAGMAERSRNMVGEGRWTILVPRGPVTTVAGGPAWFTTGENGPDEHDVARSLHSLRAVIDAAASEHRLDPSGIVIGGSSQGGAMALALALCAGAGGAGGSGRDLGGVFCVSGWLPHLTTVGYDLAAGAAGTPFLLVHGDGDEVVAVQQGRSAARLLERNGAAVTYRELSGGHDLGARSDAEVAAWLDQLGH